MKSNSLLWTFALSFSLLFSSAQSEVLDADGDGIVGPHEVLELVRLWKQEATTGVTGNSWSLTGNSGTTPGTNFLGTKDEESLEVRVNGDRALWIVPDATSPILVGGYSGNTVTSTSSGGTIAGGGEKGAENSLDGSFGFLGGGWNNSASGRYSVIAGGRGNSIEADFGVIGGGGQLSDDRPDLANRVTDDFGTVGGGSNNQAGDDAGTTDDASHATVSGGSSNEASAAGATVSGGIQNLARGISSAVSGGTSNLASGRSSVVCGGTQNLATAEYSIVAGGRYNVASAIRGAVMRGSSNSASGENAFVGGGGSNIASGDHSMVMGGVRNLADGRQGAVVGGQDNIASGFNSIVAGGVANEAGDEYSFAAGHRAKSLHRGSFVWADSAFSDFASTDDNQFLVRASGGVGLGTNNPVSQLHVAESVSGGAGIGNHVAAIENTATGASPDVLALKVHVETPDDTNNFITFMNSTGNIGAVEGNGSGGVTFKTTGGDFAEYLPVLEDGAGAPQPGDLVGLFGDKVSRRTANAHRVLIVSSAPAVLGNDPGDQEKSRSVPIAFIGQVEVRVLGPVHAGDAIVPSGRNDGRGVAIRPDFATSSIAGYAIEDSSVEDVRLIRAIVGFPQESPAVRQNDPKDNRIAILERQVESMREELNAMKKQMMEMTRSRSESLILYRQ
ncbi:MAG: hypothetical protein KC940_03160 [Candidatus Omnitrophica bacterium]|nr:hypothetical protein [Candidatus Omnitrophota bacterium]